MLSLRNKIQRLVQDSRPSQWFWAFFGISVIIRLVMVVRLVHPWWDASVYQSMARYISSGGLYGTWELFRPPLWPLILSVFSGLGPITLEWIAKIVTLVLSLGIIYLVYKIGEKITPWVGVIASALISISAPFLTFSIVPMTEIPSLFLITLAIYYFIEHKYFLTGIITGLACIMRFPAGLAIGAFGIVLIINTIRFQDFKKSVFGLFKNELMLGLGFLCIIVPLFTSNIYLYGSATLPLTIGQSMITGFMWLYQGGLWFYVQKIVTMNIVAIMVIPTIIFWIIKRKQLSDQTKKILLILLMITIVFLGYFTLQAHKEFRYSMPIFSSLFLLISTGIVWLHERLKGSRYIIIILVIVFTITTLGYSKLFDPDARNSIKPFYNFYTALSDVESGSSVITSTPTITAFSPVTLYEGYNSWEQMNQVYEKNNQRANYVAIDTCELHACEPGQELLCQRSKIDFLEKLSSEASIIYNTTTSSCDLTVYQLHTSR
jgi:hypothetical protein